MGLHINSAQLCQYDALCDRRMMASARRSFRDLLINIAAGIARVEMEIPEGPTHAKERDSTLTALEYVNTAPVVSRSTVN